MKPEKYSSTPPRIKTKDPNNQSDTEKGTLPSQLGIWRLQSLQPGGNLVAQGSWATLQLCSDVSLTSVEEVSRHIRTMEVTQWELTSQGELFTQILTFSSYIHRFNPIVEDCFGENRIIMICFCPLAAFTYLLSRVKMCKCVNMQECDKGRVSLLSKWLELRIGS